MYIDGLEGMEEATVSNSRWRKRKKLENMQNLHNLTCWGGDHYTWHIFMYKILFGTFQKRDKISIRFPITSSSDQTFQL